MDASRHESETRIDPVVVDELAFTHARLQLQDLLGTIAIDLVALAWFDTGQNADQSCLNAVVQRDIAGILVFADF